LDDTLAGVNGLIDFSIENNRLSYMVDYQTIQIVPILHRNVVNFMGMLDRHHYIATKRIKDKFMALDTRGFITCWSCVTGKLESQNIVKNLDLSGYKIYEEGPADFSFKLDWCEPRVLLISRNRLKT